MLPNLGHMQGVSDAGTTVVGVVFHAPHSSFGLYMRPQLIGRSAPNLMHPESAPDLLRRTGNVHEHLAPLEASGDSAPQFNGLDPSEQLFRVVGLQGEHERHKAETLMGNPSLKRSWKRLDLILTRESG